MNISSKGEREAPRDPGVAHLRRHPGGFTHACCFLSASFVQRSLDERDSHACAIHVVRAAPRKFSYKKKKKDTSFSRRRRTRGWGGGVIYVMLDYTRAELRSDKRSYAT